MNGRPLTDVQLAAGLRAHVPSAAPAGLRDRITTQVAATPQVRRLPWLLGLGDADPMVHRRALLLVATAALLAAVSVAVVGAWLESQKSVDDLTRSNEADAFVLASYGRAAQIPAFRLVLTDHTVYHYDGVGILREETSDGGARLLSRDFGADMRDIEGHSVWVVSGGDSSHPLATLFWSGLKNCTTGWESVETTEVIGRQARHLVCTSEGVEPSEHHVWFDIETGIPLRSGSKLLWENPSGSLVPLGIEYDTGALEFEVGPQAPSLFVTDGAAISIEEFACATDGQCPSPGPSVSPSPPMPIVSPPPAPNPGVAPSDLDAFVAGVHAGFEHGEPVDIVINVAAESRGSRDYTRLQRDGLGSVRAEIDLGEYPVVTWLLTGGRWYETQRSSDGRPWRDWGPSSGFRLDATMGLPTGCGIGWTYLGDDLVLDRPAAHIACGYQEFWVDREWLFVTRAHDHDPLLIGDPGAGLTQVVSVTFGPLPAELFAVPPPDSVWD